jgi:hypothetical protein
VREIELLHEGRDFWEAQTLGKNRTLPLSASGQLFHMVAEISIPEGAKLVFNLRGIPVTLTHSAVESGHRPAAVQGEVRKVEFLIDRTSVETFVNDGEVSSTRYALPNSSGLSVKAEGGEVMIKGMTLHPLESAWLH